MSRPEDKIEDYLVEQIEALGGECLKLEVKGRRGWLDRLCLLPFGVVIFVEVKQPDGRLSKAQKVRLSSLDQLETLHAVVWDKVSVDTLTITLDKIMSGIAMHRDLRGGAYDA